MKLSASSHLLSQSEMWPTPSTRRFEKCSLFFFNEILDEESLFNPQPPSDAVRKQKFLLEDLFSSVLLQFKKYHPSGNLKFNNLGIFQSFKLRYLMKKFFKFLLSQISLQIIRAVMGFNHLCSVLHCLLSHL